MTILSRKAMIWKLADVCLQAALAVLAVFIVRAADDLATAMLYILVTLSAWQMISCLVNFIVYRKEHRRPLRRFYEKAVLLSILLIAVSAIAGRIDFLVDAIGVNMILSILYIVISIADLQRVK